MGARLSILRSVFVYHLGGELRVRRAQQYSSRPGSHTEVERVGQRMTMMAATSDERSVMEPGRTNSGQSQPVDRLKLLYPMVNEEETPLPRSWSPKDKYNYIGLSQNNLRVHYKGTWGFRRAQPPRETMRSWCARGRSTRFYAFVTACHGFRIPCPSRVRIRAAIELLPGQGWSIDWKWQGLFFVCVSDLNKGISWSVGRFAPAGGFYASSTP